MRKGSGRRMGLAALTLALAALAPAAAPADDVPAADAVARFLAGLPAGTQDDARLAPLRGRASWAEFGRAIDERWQKLETRQLEKMRGWTASELAPRSDADRAALYPFSGPDLVNLTTLLPGRPAYVMLSLEPVGSLPDFPGFSAEDFDRFFARLQQSLHSLLKWDFFQTKDLRQDLTVPGLEGALPLLLFFAARDGLEVVDVRYLFVGPDGALREVPAAPGAAPRGEGVPGVRLALRRGADGPVSTLDYFAVDLGGYSLEQRQEFFSWLAARGPFTTYLKAASYLMFKPKYQPIERFLLRHSADVLQDDAGVPFADLRRDGWQVRLYGSYQRPIRIFDGMYQEDLAQAYGARDDVKPLPFSVGYKIRPHESTLMHATRRAR